MTSMDYRETSNHLGDAIEALLCETELVAYATTFKTTGVYMDVGITRIFYQGSILFRLWCRQGSYHWILLQESKDLLDFPNAISNLWRESEGLFRKSYPWQRCELALGNTPRYTRPSVIYPSRWEHLFE